MFHAIFAFAIITTCVITAAGILPYIHVCGRNNSNYNQCIMDNINNVRDEICKRSPEFELFSIDEIVIFDEPDFKLHLLNTKCYGICDFVINSVHVDLDKLQFNFDFVYNMNMRTSYGVDVRILVPIAHKGKVQIKASNVKLKESLGLKVITKNSKKYIYASKANTNIEFKDFDYKFDESEMELAQLHEIINNVVNDNKQIIIDKTIPVYEKKISELFIQFFNNITQSNYKKFFPEEI